MRAALLESESGLVQNIIELPDDYDANAEGSYSPPDGLTIELDPDNKAHVGGYFTNGEWTPAPSPDPPPAPEATTQEQLDALTQLLKEKAVITDAEIVDVKEPKPVEPKVADPKLGRVPEE